jgi:hypothetical protein
LPNPNAETPLGPLLAARTHRLRPRRLLLEWLIVGGVLSALVILFMLLTGGPPQTARAEATGTISGTVTHSNNTDTASPWVPDNRVWIVCTNFFIDSSASINVTGKGFSGAIVNGGDGQGPGGGAGAIAVPVGPGGAGRGR